MPFHTNGFQILPLRLSNRQRLGSYLYVILLLANICSLLTTDFLSSLYHYSPTRDCYNSIKSCGLLINSTRLRPVPLSIPTSTSISTILPRVDYSTSLFIILAFRSLSDRWLPRKVHPVIIQHIIILYPSDTRTYIHTPALHRMIPRHATVLHSYPCITSHDTETKGRLAYSWYFIQSNSFCIDHSRYAVLTLHKNLRPWLRSEPYKRIK